MALGTLVEVALPAAHAANDCFEAAFAVVEHVHRRMSPQDPASDLVQIAGRAHRGAVEVDPDTFEVLALAIEIAQASDGAFDPSAGRRMRALAALALEAGNRVRASRPVSLDLGGIAKGYAVDRAVEALQARGVDRAIVNAGGDLRVLGSGTWHLVRVRDPARSSHAWPLLELRDFALATSSDYFGSTFVDPRTGRSTRVRQSISVAAPRCAVADAMTKVVAFAPDRAPTILERFGAQAFVLQGNGGAYRAGAPSVDRLRLAA